MPKRWTCGAIALFWLYMMSWLVQRDVLPSFRHREPPSYESVLARERDEAPARWTIELGGKRVGSAQTEIERDADGALVWRGSVKLSELRLRNQERAAIELESEFHIAATGDLSSFEIVGRIGEHDRALMIRGSVSGRVLKLLARAPGFAYEKDLLYDPHDVVSGITSPLDRLRDLRLGQTWYVRELNPLSGSSLEGTRAEVTGTEDILWNGELVRTWVVARQYGGVTAKSWVREDGTVLRQEVPMLWTMLTLVRE